MTKGRPTQLEIQNWLIDQLSATLGIPSAEVDVRVPFLDYGLGSMEAVVMSGELADWLGQSLSPTLVWDYPSIEELAGYLAGERQGAENDGVQLEHTAAHATNEPIAIVGIGCRFPGANGVEAFWQLLREGVDSISEVPTERWVSSEGDSNARWGGFTNGVDRFDSAFFGIAPREAEKMDPQQRLLAEVAWEALEDAGCVLERLAGSQTGVFVGISSNDYGRRQLGGESDVYLATGNAFSIAANRLSYLFDFKGPSLSVDTACSSSLVAVHLACESLLRGETSLALAAGVNVLLDPQLTESFYEAGMLAADGRCKTFDASADGYVRGEGVGVVVLKPLSKALADGDDIYALVHGTAVNQDGRSNGLTAPNRLAQEAVLKAAYAKAGIEPKDVQYIEAHGTGTALGDPIEAMALGAVLSQGRAPENACRIGSVKTNIGHLEAAAGIAGMIKVALSLKQGMIPESLHFDDWNPHIPHQQMPLQVNRALTPWSEGSRIAGVSSFGFGGTNAHVVLGGMSPQDSEDRVFADEFVLPLSAKTPAALQELAGAYAEFLDKSEETDVVVSLQDITYTARSRRTHHDCRLGLVASTKEEMAEQLRAFADGKEAPVIQTGEKGQGDLLKPVFVYSGQGAQWIAMGKELLRKEPVFRESVESCDRAFLPYVGWSLLHELSVEGPASRMNETEVAQPAIFAIQVALTALWRSWGIEPEAVIGHSVGEVAAAYVAGVYSLEDAIHIVYHRSRLMQRMTGFGKMAMVELPLEEAEAAIAAHDGQLTVGAWNSPTSCVLSGEPDALNSVLQSLEARGVFCRSLRVDYAFHSGQMDPVLAELEEVLADLQPLPARLPFCSTVFGDVVSGENMDAAYWTRNVREMVRFSAGIDHLIERGYRTFVEVAPHPVLTSAIKQSLRHAQQQGLVLASMRREESGRATLWRSLLELYVHGLRVNWSRVEEGQGRFVRVPTYRWQHERFWLDATPIVYAARPNVEIQQEFLYEISWHEQPPVAGQVSDPAGRWLILADQAGIGDALANRLRVLGHQALVVRAEDMQNVLDTALADGSDTSGVVHLMGLDARPTEIDHGVGSALTLVQSLLATAVGRRTRIWFVTQGVQRVEQESVVTPEQAPLWGLGLTLSQEHPDLWGGLIDLQPGQSSAEVLAEQLAAELLGTDGEDQVTLREGRRYVARLQRCEERREPQGGAWKDLALRPDATYLITGGLGDLGLTVARWMVQSGACRLLLMGRNSLPPRKEWTTVDPASRVGRQIQAVMELEAMGASVHRFAVDVGDEQQLEDCLASYRQEGWPAIRGIVHAAGVAQEEPLQSLTLESMKQVLRPKVDGGWNLHRLLKDDPLDFFVLFSSISTVLSSPRLASYAAANAYLDALARLRQAAGLPVLNINWGPWAEVGMIARTVADTVSTGLERIKPEDGLRILHHLLAERTTHAAVMDMKWPTWNKLFPMTRQMPLFRSLVEEMKEMKKMDERLDSMAQGAAHRARKREEFALIQLDDREAFLQDYLREQVTRVLHISADKLDHGVSVTSLGLDSMMGVELKNRIEADLGIVVPVTSFLQGASIAELAAQLLQMMDSEERPTSPVVRLADNREQYPLSYSQRSLWFMQQMGTDNGAYNVSFSVLIHSEVESDVLRRSFEKLVERHPTLRSTFHLQGGQSVQRVHEEVEFDMQEQDVHGWELHEIKERMYQDSLLPFDFEAGPLLRVFLYHRSNDEHFMLIVAHHIALDLWGLVVLIDELRSLYPALQNGMEVEFEPSDHHYADFVQWQQELLASEEGERHWSYWQKQLQGELPVLNLPLDQPRGQAPTYRGQSHNFSLDHDLSGALGSLAKQRGTTLYTVMLAAFQVLLHRYTGQTDVLIGSPASGRTRPEFANIVGDFVNMLVYRADFSNNPAFADYIETVRMTVLNGLDHQDYPFPLLVERLQPVREPALSPLFQVSFVFQKLQRFEELTEFFVTDQEDCQMDFGGLLLEPCQIPQGEAQYDLILEVGEVNGRIYGTLKYNADLFFPETMERMAGHYSNLLQHLVADPNQAVSEVPYLSDAERLQLLNDWNDTAVELQGDSTIHQLFERQAEQTPDAVAVVFESDSLTYRELNQRANQLAACLREQGAGPDVLVGLCMERSLEMIVGLLGILKAGGAYVPLDPTYPAERIAYILQDAQAPLLVTQERLVANLPEHQAKVIALDCDWKTVAHASGENLQSVSSGENLAYVIYTSGSTGKPKGVLIEHRQAVNFFTGMDQRIGCDPSDALLAVTSICFDISVLELFYTLARGSKVILLSEHEAAGSLTSSKQTSAAGNGMDFSLFYFASDESEQEDNKYELLIEGAKFADANGFAAVWTPERHFHKFGGLYPSPAVMSAAMATITKNIKLRSGSVVLPLHHPARVAEDWSVVDNLSNGRVELSFASGWHSDDFVFAPENYSDRWNVLFENIQTVQKLWMGESVTFTGGSGQDVEVRTLPRPIQKTLPIWITAAGSPETFRKAGEMGAHLLTHLLGQSVEELAVKIKVYREALVQHGHDPSTRRVALMLHTFVGTDIDEVRETVRKPFTDYLRSSFGLVSNLAKTLNMSVNPDEMTEEDREHLLAMAFDRYFETSGLFGTPESCLEMTSRLKGIGVDEIACLVDFGVEKAQVLQGLQRLSNLRSSCQAEVEQSSEDYSIAAQAIAHQATMMQCTPSLMKILSSDAINLEALQGLRTLLLGGEALSADQARQLKAALPARLVNMYGPTEATVWATTYEVQPADTVVPIGRPFANVRTYILDGAMQPVPVGVSGELYIGGDGVARGYHNRPDLTAERFLSSPFHADRLYKTGDLVQYLPDGNIKFLGRLDDQVKIRGFRIELGEIEEVLRRHEGIQEAVVIAHGTTDKELVAYLVAAEAEQPDQQALRLFMKEQLPDYMVPSILLFVENIPYTPNGKLDRKALPDPQQFRPTLEVEYVAPDNELEQKIVSIWQEVLRVEKVGVHDSFFDLGGHSIQVVQVHGRLKEELNLNLTIVQLFQFPTVSALAAYLSEGNREEAVKQRSQDRGASRREQMKQRRESKSRAGNRRGR